MIPGVRPVRVYVSIDEWFRDTLIELGVGGKVVDTLQLTHVERSQRVLEVRGHDTVGVLRLSSTELARSLHGQQCVWGRITLAFWGGVGVDTVKWPSDSVWLDDTVIREEVVSVRQLLSRVMAGPRLSSRKHALYKRVSFVHVDTGLEQSAC
jgi:hypothetical protein